jgi:tripartite-type tricarboxylate transporter receptor subunit TctC
MKRTTSSHSSLLSLLRGAVAPALFAAATLAGISTVQAQDWPTKPVRVIVAQPAGAGPDIMARLFGDRLSKLWGQSVVVDNRPGGASIPGTVTAANAAPDGYTFYMATGGILLNVHTFKTLPYDPDRQLVPVAFIGKAPFMLSAHPSVPATTFGELVAHLKANPGKLSIASEGPRSLGGMMAEYLMVLTGTKMVHVPYNGAAAGLQDTIAGRTQLTLQSATATSPHARAGKLRPLAVTSSKPVTGFDSVPPLNKTYRDFEYVGWYMLYAPADTPAPVVQRVNRDVDRVLHEPDFAQKLAELGPEIEGVGTPASLREFHRQEHARWARLVKATKFEPQ